MKVEIRKASLEDLAVVQSLNAALFCEEYPRDRLLNLRWSQSKIGTAYFRKRVAGKEKSVCFVAVIKKNVIGYVAGSVHTHPRPYRPVPRSELENMFVKKEFRSDGIGQQLVEQFARWSRQQKVKRILVVAYAANSRAIRFYQRLNFKPYAASFEKPL